MRLRCEKRVEKRNDRFVAGFRLGQGRNRGDMLAVLGGLRPLLGPLLAVLGCSGAFVGALGLAWAGKWPSRTG